MQMCSQGGPVRQAGQRIVGGLVLEGTLLRLALADVANDRREQAPILSRDAAYRDFRRQGAPFGGAYRVFDDAAGQCVECRVPSGEEAWDEVDETAPNQRRVGAIEEPRRGRIPGGGHAVLVDANDAVGRGIDDGFQERVEPVPCDL